MKGIILLIFFIASITALNAAPKRNGVFVRYSESADYFEIMENLTKADDGVSKIYKKYLHKKFITSREDRHWVSWYEKFRLKTRRPIKSSVDKKMLFSNFDQQNDFVSLAFYDHERPLGALKALKKILKKDDFMALGKFFEHFNSKIAEIVRMSAARSTEVKSLEKELKKNRFKSVINKTAQFLAIPKHLGRNIKISFVWYPREEEMAVSYSKNHIIIRVHPEKSADIKREDLMRIFVRYLLKSQSEGQKKVISGKLLADCDPTKYFPKEDILEKTLSIVWGEMFFLKKVNKKEFEHYKTWSQNPWVNTYSKLLFPLVERVSKKKMTIMSGEFQKAATTTCDDLLALGKFI